MLHYHIVAALALIAFSPAEAYAQTEVAGAATAVAATIAPGAQLRTHEGKRAGSVFSLDRDSSGALVGVALIGPDSALVHVPIGTISGVDKSHFTTSLTYDQIFK